MFIKLLLLFILVPIAELTLLIELGNYIGFFPTLGIIALTGVVGVSLARSQGFLVISRIRESLSAGKLPANSLIEGLLILIGGVMLLTPGLLTDISGFSLVIPGTRGLIRKVVKKKLKKQINTGNLQFRFFGNSHSKQEKNDDYDNQQWESSQEQDETWDDLADSIDVEYEEIEEEDNE